MPIPSTATRWTVRSNSCLISTECTTRCRPARAAAEAAELQAGLNATQQGNPATDTADFADDPTPGNLRTDYVLPSDAFDIVDAGVFWPATDDPFAALVAGDPTASSDHRLVWVDLTTPAGPETTTAGQLSRCRPRHQRTTASTTSSTCPQLGHGDSARYRLWR